MLPNYRLQTVIRKTSMAFDTQASGHGIVSPAERAKSTQLPPDGPLHFVPGPVESLPGYQATRVYMTFKFDLRPVPEHPLSGFGSGFKLET